MVVSDLGDVRAWEYGIKKKRKSTTLCSLSRFAEDGNRNSKAESLSHHITAWESTGQSGLIVNLP
jgi:hypothetical protein